VTLAGAFFPRFIRIARGLTLAVKEEQFIEAARAIGRRDLGILARHVWPNLLGEAVVAGTLWVSAAILSEAGLSFLGLGIAPPTPTWGNMIRDGIAVILTAPWVALFPGIAIAATVVGFNMIGDAVRDYLDPRIHR
jgi:peptide/nickel transport system permease protein